MSDYIRYWVEFPSEVIKSKFLEEDNCYYSYEESHLNGEEDLMGWDLLDDLKNFSLKYPSDLFYISWEGEYYNHGIYFIRNGKYIEEYAGANGQLDIYDYGIGLSGSNFDGDSILKELRKFSLGAECALNDYELSWYPEDDLIEFSKRYPNILFTIRQFKTLEDVSILKRIYYFKNGKCQQHEIEIQEILYKIPSCTL